LQARKCQRGWVKLHPWRSSKCRLALFLTWWVTLGCDPGIAVLQSKRLESSRIWWPKYFDLENCKALSTFNSQPAPQNPVYFLSEAEGSIIQSLKPPQNRINRKHVSPSSVSSSSLSRSFEGNANLLPVISLCAANNPALPSVDSAINAMANAPSATPTFDPRLSFASATNAPLATIRTSAWFAAARASRMHFIALSVRG
jgi:hypothetical protein